MIEREFEKAHRRATFREILAFVTGRPSLLLQFEWVREQIGAVQESYAGIEEIPLDKIVGSVNRYREFDRAFFPRSPRTGERWSRVLRSYYESSDFAPILVYQVGDTYFVVDGNHRVSVARQLGLPSLRAEVTRFKTPVPLDKDVDIPELIIKAEYRRFLEKTHLDRLRPKQRIEFTRNGRYRVLLNHIDVHAYFRARAEGREVPYEEAVASWYDTVYCPVIEAIRRGGLLEQFPTRTEADLYVWMARHVYELGDRYAEPGMLEQAVQRFARRFTIPRLLEHLRRRLR